MLGDVTARPLALETERLRLAPLTAGALDALIDNDRARLEAFTGARFPEPLPAPPLMEDALPSLRDELLTAEGRRAGDPGSPARGRRARRSAVSAWAGQTNAGA
jgi:hypothetical protein